MKAFTDLNQSKKLAEILPFESADMGYIPSAEDDDGSTLYTAEFKSEFIFDEVCIPCWSLAALLSLIPEVSLNTFKDGKWNAMIQSGGKMIYADKDNPLDACYEMIVKLHELNLL